MNQVTVNKALLNLINCKHEPTALFVLPTRLTLEVCFQCGSTRLDQTGWEYPWLWRDLRKELKND